jgi:hypothetical protein
LGVKDTVTFAFTSFKERTASVVLLLPVGRVMLINS